MLDKSLPYMGVFLIRKNHTPYPRYSLPEGFQVTGYRPGNETAWAELLYGLGMMGTLEDAKGIFEREFLPYPDKLKKQCLFVLSPEGEVAATASLWDGEIFGKTMLRVHWVGVSPKYQRMGLMKGLLTKILDLYEEIGPYDFLYLETQTWSWKAINLYESFGFIPYLGEKPVNWTCSPKGFEEDNRIAWEIIDQKLEQYAREKAAKKGVQEK